MGKIKSIYYRVYAIVLNTGSQETIKQTKKQCTELGTECVFSATDFKNKIINISSLFWWWNNKYSFSIWPILLPLTVPMKGITLIFFRVLRWVISLRTFLFFSIIFGEFKEKQFSCMSEAQFVNRVYKTR